MRKTDKKKEKAIIQALTRACEIAKDRGDGFLWLTHFVDYDRFPASLEVVCVYRTNKQLARADREAIIALVTEQLRAIDIKLADGRRQVSFDTEENCEREHNGRWQDRFG
ncbi:hypothetical protein [Gilvimarinus sp. DA14]|uniref:hypothetical protein n=1 Tax=Gilvimarinus sp. DA14 TaxID=2956798 RepID=UPI0020B89340|nr:hypothetical protein [Gilvimarinus sp. DA14]UTF61827.1 hypothetical protein NHM04_08555 [Gilvimarinus sp. DA14]